MKNKLSVFTGGTVTEIIVTLVAIGFVLPGKMFIVNESKRGFSVNALPGFSLRKRR